MPNTFQENLAENAYFQSLPVFVQETIRQRGDHVCTRDALLSYADKLTRGDD